MVNAKKHRAKKQKTKENQEEIVLRICEQMDNGFERESASWTIRKVIGMIKDGIIHDASYQRGKIWDRAKQQGLISTIIRYGGEKIPTITLRLLPDGTYEIVDGKQRLLSAIYPFTNDEFGVNGVYNEEIKGFTCSDLYEEKWRPVHTTFMSCRLPLEIMKDMSDEEAITYFIQINSSGVSVSLGEKIHAMQGTPIIQTIESLKEHPIWENISQKRRYNEYAYIGRMLLFVRDKKEYTDTVKCYTPKQLLDELDVYRGVNMPKRVVNSVKETFDFLNKILRKHDFKVNITEFFSIFLYTNLYQSSLKLSSFGDFINGVYYRVNNPITNTNSRFRLLKTKHNDIGFKYNAHYYNWYLNTISDMLSIYVNGGDWDDIGRLSIKEGNNGSMY